MGGPIWTIGNWHKLITGLGPQKAIKKNSKDKSLSTSSNFKTNAYSRVDVSKMVKARYRYPSKRLVTRTNCGLKTWFAPSLSNQLATHQLKWSRKTCQSTLENSYSPRQIRTCTAIPIWWALISRMMSKGQPISISSIRLRATMWTFQIQRTLWSWCESIHAEWMASMTCAVMAVMRLSAKITP